GEGGDQRGRQVIHAEVAQILEALDGVAAPRPRHARDDDEARRGKGRGRLLGGHAFPQRFLGWSRRWCDGRMPSSSRYLATVRRAMVRPCPRRTWAISWSDRRFVPCS